MAIKGYPHQKFALSARNHRNLNDNSIGVVEPGDLIASAGAGYASALTSGRVRMRPNQAGVYKGVYEVWNDAALSLTHTNPAGNPRIDQIVARVSDIADLGSGSDLATIAIVDGTATVGATLDNRNGATALAANEILLWDVLVPNGAASAASFTYRDRRAFGSLSVIPRAVNGTTFDAVLLDPVGMAVERGALIPVAAVNYQGACRVYLDTPITATKIRFSYVQGGTAATGNFVVSIYDASGRLVVSTSSTAFAGTANTLQAQSLTIASTRFEAGIYYVHIGTTIATASSSVLFNGVIVAAASIPPPPVGNAKYSTTGGVTPPATLLSMTDFGSALAGATMSVPLVELATA